MDRQLYDFIHPRPETAMAGVPPVLFQDVGMYVFPLRAHYNQLHLFCHNYLNIFPQRHLFRPSVPFVLMEVLSYGRMTPTAIAHGWVAQNEVVFAIPLEWYVVENGRPRFRDWVLFSPFIYVDSQQSVLTGTEVYGWPKVTSRFHPATGPWEHDPRGDESFLAISTQVVPEVYAGERIAPRVIMEIEHEHLPKITESPLPVELWGEGPRWLEILADHLSFGYSDLLSLFFSQFTHPFGRGDSKQRPIAGGELSKLWRWLGLLTRGFGTVNLKQFRQTGASERAAYQALTNAPIQIVSIERSGFLGDHGLLLGDLTGRYKVLFHEYAAQPIVESLGIDVEPVGEVDGVPVTMTRPLLPIWLEVDLLYGKGEVLEDLATYERAIRASGPPPEEAGQSARMRALRNPSTVGRFNNTRGAAVTAMGDQAAFGDATVLVLPLLSGSTEEYLEAINEGIEGRRFEPLGSYVYLVVVLYDKMLTRGNNLGWWAVHEVSLHVPVRTAGAGPSLGGTLVALSFMDTSPAVLTRRETYGWPCVFGEFEVSPDLLMDPQGPTADRHLFSLKTELATAQGMGQPLQKRVLLEILNGESSPPSERELEGWGKHLLDELIGRASFVAGGGEIWNRFNGLAATLGQDGWQSRVRQERTRAKEDLERSFRAFKAFADSEKPLRIWSLKQFRDAADPMMSCYRSVSESHLKIVKVHQVDELPHPMQVRLHYYPTHPLADLFQLVDKTREMGASPLPGRRWEGAGVLGLEAVRPFRMKVDLALKGIERPFEPIGEDSDGVPVSTVPPHPQKVLELALSDCGRREEESIWFPSVFEKRAVNDSRRQWPYDLDETAEMFAFSSGSARLPWDADSYTAEETGYRYNFARALEENLLHLKDHLENGYMTDGDRENLDKIASELLSSAYKAAGEAVIRKQVGNMETYLIEAGELTVRDYYCLFFERYVDMAVGFIFQNSRPKVEAFEKSFFESLEQVTDVVASLEPEAPAGSGGTESKP